MTFAYSAAIEEWYCTYFVPILLLNFYNSMERGDNCLWKNLCGGYLAGKIT